jgi:hypothetical protein
LVRALASHARGHWFKSSIAHDIDVFVATRPVLLAYPGKKYSRLAHAERFGAGQAVPRGTDRLRGVAVGARLDAGAIVDEVVVEDGSVINVRFERCPAGWQASFELSHPDVEGLSVVHRLVTDTLPEARASVPAAVAFLMGRPVDEPI